MKEISSNKVNRSADFMVNRIDEIVTDRLKKYPTYSGAIVASLNPDNTVNVYIPPNNKVVFTRISNQTSFPLAVGDSVELLLKDGSYNNCWIVAKHGVSFNETITDEENQELDAAGRKVIGNGTGGGIISDEDYVTNNTLRAFYLTSSEIKKQYVAQADLNNLVTTIVNAILEKYAKKSDLDAYITNDELTNILKDYATNAKLNDYPTNNELNSKLNGYITQSQLDTILQDYVKKTP